MEDRVTGSVKTEVPVPAWPHPRRPVCCLVLHPANGTRGSDRRGAVGEGHCCSPIGWLGHPTGSPGPWWKLLPHQAGSPAPRGSPGVHPELGQAKAGVCHPEQASAVGVTLLLRAAPGGVLWGSRPLFLRGHLKTSGKSYPVPCVPRLIGPRGLSAGCLPLVGAGEAGFPPTCAHESPWDIMPPPTGLGDKRESRPLGEQRPPGDRAEAQTCSGC